MADIGSFLSAGTASIPAGTQRVRTSCWGTLGWGAADYIADPLIDANYAAANSLWSFYNTAISTGFRLATDQVIWADMFGAIPDGNTDYSANIQAGIDFVAGGCQFLGTLSGTKLTVADLADCTVTASISGNILNVTGGPAAGKVLVGQTITGSGILPNTIVSSYNTGAGAGTGGSGTYIVNNAQSVSSMTMNLIASLALPIRLGSVIYLASAFLSPTRIVGIYPGTGPLTGAGREGDYSVFPSHPGTLTTTFFLKYVDEQVGSLNFRPGVYICQGLVYPATGVRLQGVDPGCDNQGSQSGVVAKLQLPMSPANLTLLTLACGGVPTTLLTTSAYPPTVRNVELSYLVLDGGATTTPTVKRVTGSKLLYHDPIITQTSFYQIRLNKVAFNNADFGFFLNDGFYIESRDISVWNCSCVGILVGDSCSNTHYNPNIGMMPSGGFYTISMISNEASATLTTMTPHDFVPGDLVYIDNGVTGMTQMANEWCVVASATSTTVVLKARNTNSYPAYTSGGRICRYSVGMWVHGTNDLILNTSTSSERSGAGSVLFRVGYSASRSPWHTTSKAGAYAKFESGHFEGATGSMLDVCSGANVVIDGSTNCITHMPGYTSPINFQYLTGTSRIDSLRFLCKPDPDPINAWDPNLAGSYISHVRVQSFRTAASGDLPGRLFITPCSFQIADVQGVSRIPVVAGLSEDNGLTYNLGRVECFVTAAGSNQSIATGTETKIIFSNIVRDTNSSFRSSFTATFSNISGTGFMDVSFVGYGTVVLGVPLTATMVATGTMATAYNPPVSTPANPIPFPNPPGGQGNYTLNIAPAANLPARTVTTPPSTFTCPVPALYSITGKLTIAAAESGKTYRVILRVNGVDVDYVAVQATATDPITLPFAFAQRLAVNDQVELYLLHNASASASVVAGTAPNTATNMYIGVVPPA